MSRIAPDIPELRTLPEVARPLVYMSALAAAIRSPATLIPGCIVSAIAVMLGAIAGVRWMGATGLIIGTILGAVTAAVFFYKVLLPWRARRMLPQVLRQQDPRAFDELGRADDALRRMAAAYEERERTSSASHDWR